MVTTRLAFSAHDDCNAARAINPFSEDSAFLISGMNSQDTTTQSVLFQTFPGSTSKPCAKALGSGTVGSSPVPAGSKSFPSGRPT